MSVSRVMRTSGEVWPEWYGLDSAWSLRDWFNYARGVDFIVLRSDKYALPFADKPSLWFGYFTPTLWVTIAILALFAVTLLTRGDHSERSQQARLRRGWTWLALLLFAGAWVGPDNFGGAHGGILRERLLLLAMAISPVAFNLDLKRWSVRLCGVSKR